MTGLINERHPERSEGSLRLPKRFFASLRMTGLQPTALTPLTRSPPAPAHPRRRYGYVFPGDIHVTGPTQQRDILHCRSRGIRFGRDPLAAPGARGGRLRRVTRHDLRPPDHQPSGLGATSGELLSQPCRLPNRSPVCASRLSAPTTPTTSLRCAQSLPRANRRGGRLSTRPRSRMRNTTTSSASSRRSRPRTPSSRAPTSPSGSAPRPRAHCPSKPTRGPCFRSPMPSQPRSWRTRPSVPWPCSPSRP
jgi:hypothetical protein